jgi:DNA-directed RNA polymerase subunit RPC12/RpoP
MFRSPIMSVTTNYKCICGHIFEVWKNTLEEDFPSSNKCPSCSSLETYRMWSMPTTSIAEGLTGNSKNNFESSLIYKPSTITGKLKGKRIR